MIAPTECPDCQATVVDCDNGVRLDYPAAPWDGGRWQWTIMPVGGLFLATAGDPSPDGFAHTLHEHQPAEGVANGS